MANDERINAIVDVISKGDDKTLQSLFEKAATAGISSALIIRIWYRQVNLEKQSAKVIQFLYEALIDKSRIEVERPSQEPVDLTRVRKNKLEFLNDESVPASVRKRCSPLFDGVYSIEVSSDCDIREMEREQFVDAFESLGHYNRKYIASALSVMNHYFRWSKENKKKVHPCWFDEFLTADDIDTTEAMRQCCYKDAAMLRDTIMKNVEIDNMQSAPPLAVLAWMDFDLDEALDIKNEEVDLASGTIRGRSIPLELRNIIQHYYTVGDQEILVRANRGYRRVFVEDLGFFMKPRSQKLKRKPLNESAAKAAMSAYRLSYKDIQMSSRYCRLHDINLYRMPTSEDVREIFHIKNSDQMWKINEDVGTRLLEYQSFLNAFYLNKRP